MSNSEPDAPDTLHSAQVTDHKFNPPPGQEWGLCTVEVNKNGKKFCGLGRAAHKEAHKEYVPDSPRAPVVELCTCGHPKNPTQGSLGHKASGNKACNTLGCNCKFFDSGDVAGRLQELAKEGGLSVTSTTKLPITGPVPTFLLEDTVGKMKVDGERQAQHGDPVPNMERIANGWSTILGVKFTAHQVALAMIEFKIVRSLANPMLWDNYDDMEGYADIARRCAKTDKA